MSVTVERYISVAHPRHWLASFLIIKQGCDSSAAQKIKKWSETPVTVHNIAKLCVIDGKNKEITKKLVQPVPPPPLLDPWEFQWENDQKNKMAKNHFSGVQNDSQSV